MARLAPEMVKRARDVIALYPEARSALIPLLHLAQEQDGWLAADAMAHVAELVGVTPAEVLGTASFYDMLFTEPVGQYLVSVCTNIACMLNGGVELLEHAEQQLGVKAGGTTPDGLFTLEEVECIALCGDAPCLAVNWRFRGNVANDAFDRLVADLRAGELAEEIPPHGTLNRVRRTVGLAAATVTATHPPRADQHETSEPRAATSVDQGTRDPQPSAGTAPEHAATADRVEHPPPADTADTADTASELDGSRPQKAGD
ncbi:MAG TPA: NAD(P)H-dependent oxidoreductase subunit E [Acidimicrobiales bacterium]|nr:NAD(P)H-dependent oxidoreductase subunit E [Acidimicrobiales bacterium]